MAFKYHPISTRFWTDEKVLSWTEDARLLALYLLTCPHRTSEGLFRLPKHYVLADLGWTAERLAKPFGQLLADGFIKYDDKVSVILLCQALKYRVPENPNQVTAAIHAISELPATPLLGEFRRLAQLFSQRLYKALEERFGQSPSPSPSPSPTLLETPPPPSGDEKRKARQQKAIDERVKPVLDYFHQNYKAVFGSPPVIQGGRDGNLIRSVPKEYTADRLCTLMDTWFKTRDKPYLWRAGDIPSFVAAINNLVPRAAPSPAAKLQAPIREADIDPEYIGAGNYAAIAGGAEDEVPF